MISATGSAAPEAVQVPPGDAGVQAAKRPPAPGVFDELSIALASARAGVSSFLDLMSFEARRAALALMWMVAWGVVAAICIVAAWLSLMAALVMWVVSLGVAPIAAVIAAAVLNGVIGVWLFYIGIGLSHDLLFSATRRQVAGKSRAMPTSP